MKKRLFKLSLFIILILSLSFAVGFSSSAAKVTSGDFVFDVSGNSATLTEYKGSSTAVTIPSKVNSATVTAIGKEAFWQNTAMTSVSIPSTVKTIGDAAFNECKALKKVVIPSKVTTLGSSVFWYCTNLESVVIPASVKKIGTGAFKGCEKLTAYVVKDSFGEDYIKGLDYVKLAYRYATELKLSLNKLTLTPGTAGKLTYTLSPSPLYSDKVKFTSSNTKVATVSSSGTVTAKAVGTAVITATATDSGKVSASCSVSVKPSTVSGFKAGTLTVSSAQLKWSKTDQATGYRIYKYNEATKKWASLAVTTNLSYTDKTAKIGQTSQYKIRAYTKTADGNVYSSYSKVLKVTMPAPGLVSSLTASATTNQVVLKWKKAECATNYKIYQYNPSTKKYVAKTTTTALTTTIKSLTANKEYTFAVRAYYKDKNGTTYAEKYEKIKISTRPIKITTLSVVKDSESFSSVSFKWTSLSSVTGYQISCTPEGGKAIVKTVTGAKTNSLTVDGLIPGTAYSFKIRAYTKRASGTAYGYYSSAVKATTLTMPETPEKAFDAFIEAYNATKAFGGNAVLYKQTEIVGFSGADNHQSIIDATAKNQTSIIKFLSGKDSSGKTVSHYINPSDAPCSLTGDMLLKDSLTYDGNGSGYEISFGLALEDASAISNSLIAPVINWAEIEKTTESFKLVSCNYPGTVINAKVQDKLISHMEVSMPVEVTYTMSGETFTFSTAVVTTYAFINF